MKSRTLTRAELDAAEFIGVYAYTRNPRRRSPIRVRRGRYYNLIGVEVKGFSEKTWTRIDS